MPEITTIRVVRSRKVQPEQFGSAGAEVELFGTVHEGENHVEATRTMLAEARALVYENLGLTLPAGAVAVAASTDAPAEAKKPRGRPAGTKNTRPKAGTKAAKAAEKAAEAPAPAPATPAAADPSMPPDDDDSDVPGISTGDARVGPEDNPEDHEIPGETAAPAAEAGAVGSDDYTVHDLQADLMAAISAETLTVQGGRQLMAAYKVKRIRDLNPEQVAKFKAQLDELIAKKEG
jgi:hypothetical protein